jgi:phage FluMu protein Com
MRCLTYIVKGKAQVQQEGLRCAAPRNGRPGWICNKLIVRKNSMGQVAGEFKCERCSQIIEVQSRPVEADDAAKAAN